MHIFTSITTCYLPKARVLAETLKKHNPDAVMHLVVADDLPSDFELKNEYFDYVWDAESFIKTKNNKKWFYEHTVVELCTAIKGAATLQILKETNADKVVYLDPDIGVFDSLAPISDMLDKNSVLLTPHLIDPAPNKSSIMNDEICALKHGIYNFGFFAVKNDENGIRFLNWWNNRLMEFCYDDIPNGLFTDQKWGDIAPALFDFLKIIHEPEYNVATWNLSTRVVSGNKESGWKVNGRPLKFFHFTGFDSGAHREMLGCYARTGDPVWNLSLMYEKMLYEKGQNQLGKVQYRYATYDNGEKINKWERIVFRKRRDVYNRFDNPFGDECYRWMRKNVPNGDNINIIKLCEKKFFYKILYKISLLHWRKKYKASYIYYDTLIKEIEQGVKSIMS